ncbi:MAG: hypothetical protein ABR970_16690 [Roseiarcus sp.]|jgi:hypothetical protein
MSASRFFHLYAYACPAILTPLAFFLWRRHYDGNAQLAAVALGIPIAHAYLVPGIGTNVLKMWRFNARLKLGALRPHHGFVFGGATATLSLPIFPAPSAEPTASSILGVALGVGALLLFVNWIYDALALRHGVLEVYNQPWADGAGPWAIAADYACWFFGVFGLLYGAGLRFAEGALLAAPSWGEMLAIGAGLVIATAVLPTLGYICSSYLRHGHSGCRPIARGADA